MLSQFVVNKYVEDVMWSMALRGTLVAKTKGAFD